ncbi:hypothetical protein FKW77_006344 [Venturia effusa]|uniref:Uncharacterized protein n=1 Tax=Venturia effusa TaxID=50376 RepID=A0A517L5I2_9PEZI|nr:hypothetical protein FKW77_006344 [Venturia effusa]
MASEYEYRQPEHHQLAEYRRPQPNNYPTPPRSSSPKEHSSYLPAALPTPTENPAPPLYSRSNLEAYQNGQYSHQEQYSTYPPQQLPYYNELNQYHAKNQTSPGTPGKSSYNGHNTQYHAEDHYSASTGPRQPSYNIHALGIEDEPSHIQPRKPSKLPSRPPSSRPRSPLHRSRTPSPPTTPPAPAHARDS